MFSIDRLQADEDQTKQNPRVRSRVENVCRLLSNSLGECRLTYDPAACPLLDGDFKMVGWKPTTSSGRGKLDDGGEKNRTHASDAAGYVLYKVFPPGQRASIVASVPSSMRENYDLIVNR
jgi:hypothetical protein